MNIAFSAILGFALLIPGLIFFRARRAFGRFSTIVPAAPSPLSLELGSAFVVSCLINAFLCGAVSVASKYGLCYRPDIPAVIMLLIGRFGDHDVDFSRAVNSIADFPYSVLLYFLLACAGGFLAGALGGKLWESLLEQCKMLDVRDSTVQEWRRFLNAENGAFVTAVVDMGGVAYLFIGILTRLHFSPTTGELERLQLDSVAKRPLNAESSVFADVYGHQFSLRMSELKTLNVIYVDQQR